MQNTKRGENLIFEDIEEEKTAEYEETTEYEENTEGYEDIGYEDDMEYKEEVTVKDITDEEDLIVQDMADFLKIFGDYSRIKIIECIMDIKYTVRDIADFTGLTHSAVSHHLKVLRQAKLVARTRGEKNVYYEVVDKHVKEIYNLTRTHIKEFQKTISAREEYDEMAEIFNEELYSKK